MTTPNIVPRGNGEGGIGTNEKFWKNGYFENLQTRGGAVATENHVQLSIKNHNDDIDAHSAAISKHNSATSVHTANLASKAEAEAGTDTSKFMTPARTREAMQTFVGGDLTGMIFAFAGNTIPSGYLACNGAAISRTTYADLFAVIGTTYGTGDGSTTFNLPNLTDKFIQGSDTAGTVKSAGLPNITGKFRVTNEGNVSGAFSNFYMTNQDDPYEESGVPAGVDFDASRCSSIYGNSDTVQPPALTMRYIIKY